MKTKELPIPYQNKCNNNNNKIIIFLKNQRFDEKQKGEVVVQNLKISIWGKRKEMVLANRWQKKKKVKPRLVSILINSQLCCFLLRF